ncbi:helix-turn-helix domain-containing protein [uncultured Nitratireductor sp.]|uniref:helix-turn-helix transcriptional regulator n=1 Tax=uncultured Nitratireductor sp. TaxID=520953 RepID=UPI00262E3823|nr:helix-turn-helix domain-containing protein [uncultured Nitratireductor sp.]
MEDKKVLSIQEFCSRYGICRSFFHKLERDGKAPKSFKLGARRLIPSSAVSEWEAERCAEAA